MVNRFRSIEDRYKNLVEVARSRAILTVGISCFKEDPSTIASAQNSITATHDSGMPSYHGNSIASGHAVAHYKAETFNLSVLCSQEFVVEPGSLQFLIQHGFDFNKQFSKGISYHRGIEKVNPYLLSSHSLLLSCPAMLYPAMHAIPCLTLLCLNEIAKLKLFIFFPGTISFHQPYNEKHFFSHSDSKENSCSS